MLAMADRQGRVWASIPGLANRARISVDDCRAAIKFFMAPDVDSRTKDHEGRRIEEIDGGWKLLNHAKYRAIRDEEAILEAKRKYINTRRAVENVDRSRAIAEAEAEAEAIKPPLAPPSRRKGNGEPRDRKKSATRVPDSFEVTEPMWAWAQEQGVAHDRIEAETAKFMDHHKAKGSLFSDWHAGWRKWMRNAVEFAQRPR